MKRTKCEECAGRIVRQKVEFELYGVRLGKFPADVCLKCGEEVFDEQASDRIDEIAKKKGLWGLSATTKVGKCGNALDIRLNKRIADFLGIHKGSGVTIAPESKKKLVIEVQQ
jgi:hypothetical protein